MMPKINSPKPIFCEIQEKRKNIASFLEPSFSVAIDLSFKFYRNKSKLGSFKILVNIALVRVKFKDEIWLYTFVF